jgi:hypothetical protein
MAPSAKNIEQALVDGTCAVYRAEPDATSVNKVRKHVTDELDLDEEFFASAKWKAKSKTIIKETVVRRCYTMQLRAKYMAGLIISVCRRN